jgi:hypothetical protein
MVSRRGLRVLVVCALVGLGLIAAPLSRAAGATLSGQVIGALHGQQPKPMVGATVTVAPAAGGEAIGSTTTNTAGRYALDVPAGVYAITAVPKEGAPFEAFTYAKVEVPQSQQVSFSLEPIPAVHLSGTVRDAAGEPVAGLRFQFNGAGPNGGTGESGTATTEADGSYSVWLPPDVYVAYAWWTPNTAGHASVPPNGFGFSTSEFTIESEQKRNVILPATSLLTIETVGKEAVPIPGVTVSIGGATVTHKNIGGFVAEYLNSEYEEGRTDSEGRFTARVFTGSEAGNGYAHLAPGAEYDETYFQTPAVNGNITTVVRLADTVRLTGIVRDAEGEPLAGAHVGVLAHRYAVEGVTGEDGSYSLNIRPGEYDFTLSWQPNASGHPGLPTGGLRLATHTGVIEADRELDLTLPPTSELGVEVLGRGGTPIEGADVSVPEAEIANVDLGGYETHEFRTYGTDGLTGADGRFTTPLFDGSVISSGIGTVRPPSAEEYGSAEFSVPSISEDTTVVVHPTPTVRLAGTIRDADGEPLAGAQVSLDGESVDAEAVTGKDGSYLINVLPGVYNAYASWTGEGTEGPSGLPENGVWMGLGEFALESNQERDITLPPTARLSVEALGRDHKPVKGVGVYLHAGPVVGYDLGGFGSATVYGSAAELVTGVDGKVSTMVFDGAEEGFRGASISPPPWSGYRGDMEVNVPTIEGDTTMVVNLLPGTEEEIDSEPPRLEGLSIEPSRIDTASEEISVTLVAQIIDEESGFAGGYATFDAPGGGPQVVSGEFVQGSAEGGNTFEALATFPQGGEPGDWIIGDLTLFDHAGNEVVFGPEQLIERGMPYEVTVAKPSPPPVVTGISPASGPETGGTVVHLIGSGFDGATAVHFGGSLAEFVLESPESLTAYAPPGTGNVGVVVTTPGGTSPEVNYAYAPSAAVSLTNSANPSVHGQKVTFTAVVEPAKGGPTPLGTVTFVEGTTALGVVNLSKGKATLNTATIGAGEHPVVAEYSGDSHYGAAASSPVTQVVAKATTELTLTSSLNPAPFGSGGTLKAHVAAVAPGAGTPAGTVTFSEGETVLGTVQLSGGNASLSLKTLAPGEHAVSATYSGDANDKASEAGPVNQVVTKASTELALTSTLNPAPFGSSATLKATVKAVAPGGGTPTGTVTFREGETVLATVPLSAGSAKYALKTTAPGEHEITATYSGEADYEASSGGIVQAIVVASTELALTSSKNPAAHGSSGTLKATVKTIAPGGGTPAGTVTFREGETVLAVIPLSSGAATYPLKALTVGEHKITATYSGNADYGTSEATIGQVITP